MKKFITILLALLTLTMAFASCAKDGAENSTDTTNTESNTQKIEIKDSADALNQVFDKYAEDEKFSMMGGDIENIVDGAAGIYNLTDTDGLISTLHISDEIIANIEETSSAVHAMNANTFTSASFKLKDGVKADEFAASLKESVLSTQWMCGFPEHITIYTVGDGYVVYALGALDLVENFNSKLETVYGDSAIKAIDEAVE